MLHGADVSSYQPAAYPTAGLSFVFIKLTEGIAYVNPKWTAQRTTARRAELVTGFYHYPHIANSPVAEANHFLDQIHLDDGDLLCLDWEWNGQGVSAAQACSYKDAWLGHVKSKAPRHRVVLYCARSDWLEAGTDERCGDGLWIADRTAAGKPRVKHHWTFHQYGESRMDNDVANFGSVSALREWAGGSGGTVIPQREEAVGTGGQATRTAADPMG